MMRRLALLLGLFGLISLATPLTVAAYDPFSGVDCSQASNSAVCQDQTSASCSSTGSGCDQDPATKTLVNVTRILAVAAGITAVIMLIVGGIKYVTSNGDSNAIGSAKNTIINAMVGIVIIVLAQAIIVFAIEKLNL